MFSLYYVLTNILGTNAVISAFVPICHHSSLYNFYTSL